MKERRRNNTKTTFLEIFFIGYHFITARKFARWTALLSGIAYGVTRYNYLAKREIGIQKHENEVREQYKKKKAIQDELNMKAEMEALGKEAGVVAK